MSRDYVVVKWMIFFSTKSLQVSSVHKRILQGLYKWAGEFWTVWCTKGQTEHNEQLWGKGFHVYLYQSHNRFMDERRMRFIHLNAAYAIIWISDVFTWKQILLDELGFDESFITLLRELYLRPLMALLYSDCGGSCLDSHKAFVVKYSMGEDLDLSYHYDNAEVTLNVSLGKEFTEGNLFFGDMRQVLRVTVCNRLWW